MPLRSQRQLLVPVTRLKGGGHEKNTWKKWRAEEEEKERLPPPHTHTINNKIGLGSHLPTYVL
jgi:hypothetical protein